MAGALSPPSPPWIGPRRDLSVAVVSGKERKWRRSRARPKSRPFLRGFVQFPPTRCLSGKATGPGGDGEGVSCPLGLKEGRDGGGRLSCGFKRRASTLGPDHFTCLLFHFRPVSIVAPRVQVGPASPMVCFCVLTAQECIAPWVSILALSGKFRVKVLCYHWVCMVNKGVRTP